jgi:hypothetical protein
MISDLPIYLKHPNRANKRKNKQGSGCKMCKPWKGEWEPRFKKKERVRMSEEFAGALQ